MKTARWRLKYIAMDTPARITVSCLFTLHVIIRVHSSLLCSHVHVYLFIGVGSKSILGGGTNIHCDRGDLRCVLSLEDKDWLNENCVTNWSFFIASIYVYRLTVTIIITASIGLAISCRVLKPAYKRGFGEGRSRTFWANTRLGVRVDCLVYSPNSPWCQIIMKG